MKIDLHEYDLIVLNLSGGKDSQAMLDFVHGMAVKQGVESRLIAVHADLGKAEWAGVKELVQEQVDHYDIPLRVIARPQGDLLTQIRARGMWPSSTARYCTSDQKRSQIDKVIRAEAKKRDARTVLNCLGLRSQESPARAKKAEFQVNKRLTIRSREVYDWLPILDWSEDEVWQNIQSTGVRHHEAYDLGMPRLSCVFCIFAPKSALVIAGKHNPELLDEYVQMEKEMNHTFRMDVSMADVKEAVEQGIEVESTDGNWNM